MKRLSLMIHLLFLGSLLTTLMWYMENDNHHRLLPKAKGVSRSCKNCGENIITALELYSQPWKKNESNYQTYRSLLNNQCNGFDKAIITQTNSPVGAKLVYDGEKRTLEVTSELFSSFPKNGKACQGYTFILVKNFLQDRVISGSFRVQHELAATELRIRSTAGTVRFRPSYSGHPFSNKTVHTCAVVGNGGILANSNCGEMIDSAQFVFRCNLPPLSKEFVSDVGTKTNLVTGNPTIFLKKYGSLIERRRPLIESLRSYGDSMLLLSAFSFGMGTAVSLRTLYTIEDFESPIRPVFFNPQYLQKLAVFWRSQGLQEFRLSTGIMMVSLALELCENVHVYGFWPFSVHPFNLQDVNNHYYDIKPSTGFHAMPSEFNKLVQLHSQGVLKLHLGDCGAEGS